MKNDNFVLKEKNQVIDQINIVLFGLGIKHTRFTVLFFFFFFVKGFIAELTPLHAQIA